MKHKHLAFFDVDGTLSIPFYDIKGNGILKPGGPTDWWIQANAVDSDIYRYCKAPKNMKNLVHGLNSLSDWELFILTQEADPNAFLNKKKFVRGNYIGMFDDAHCIAVPKAEDKIDILQQYGKLVKPYDIMFWDDDLMLVIHASSLGFDAHHISEMLEYN